MYQSSPGNSKLLETSVLLPHRHFINVEMSKFPVKDELTICSKPIAQGRERTCFLHPRDPEKIIKISTGSETTQSRREIDFFESLEKRNFSDYRHLPKYYGTVNTNLGWGLVVDLICDYDKTISNSLEWYIENGTSIPEVENHLEVLREYLLENLIIFNHDLCCANLLLQKISEDSAQLVIIDGLGDVVSIPWLNRFPSHVRSKISRRWARFMERFYAEKYVIKRQQQSS